MFRTKYTLSELARMLRRSEQSLLRDIKMGRLPAGSSRRRRRMGKGTRYEFAHQDLMRNLPTRDIRRLNSFLGKKTVPEEEQVATRGIKRCKTCEMYRPVSKYPFDPESPDKLSADCITCVDKQALPKVKLKQEISQQRLAAGKKSGWSGYFRRAKK